MKTLLKIALSSLLLGVFSMNAQEASDECKKNASLGIESAKVKNYAEAEPYLLKVRQNCPSYSLATYISSERLLRDKLKKAAASQKETVVNELIALFKERKQYFSSKTPDGDLHSDIALLMFENNIGTKSDQYEKFKQAYKDKKHFRGPKKLYTFFELLVDLQADGKKDVQEVFDLYEDLSEKIEVEKTKTATLIEKYSAKEESGQQLLKKEKKSLDRAEKNLAVYGQVESAIDGKLGKLADCPNLIPLFTEQYAANENNLEWVKQSARRLYAKECTSEPLFVKLVEKQHQLEPSADTAEYLGKLAAQRGDKAAARKYYEDAANRQTNPNKKARAFYAIATDLKNKGSLSQARNYYRKALKARPSFGAAYLQIANMIANSANSCGQSTFDKQAVYWLAANYANKAARIDPSVASNAKQAAASYTGRAPSKTEVFQKGMQGKSISIGCWIGESVKVPNL